MYGGQLNKQIPLAHKKKGCTHITKYIRVSVAISAYGVVYTCTAELFENYKLGVTYEG